MTTKQAIHVSRALGVFLISLLCSVLFSAALSSSEYFDIFGERGNSMEIMGVALSLYSGFLLLLAVFIGPLVGSLAPLYIVVSLLVGFMTAAAVLCAWWLGHNIAPPTFRWICRIFLWLPPTQLIGALLILGADQLFHRGLTMASFAARTSEGAAVLKVDPVHYALSEHGRHVLRIVYAPLTSGWSLSSFMLLLFVSVGVYMSLAEFGSNLGRIAPAKESDDMN